MKCDFELLNEIEEVICASARCKQMIEDLFEMTGQKDKYAFLFQQDSIFNHTDIALNYILQIDKRLNNIVEKIERDRKSP